MDRLSRIKLNLEYGDEDILNVSKSDIDWLIEQAEKFEKLAFDYDDLTLKIEELKEEAEGWKQDCEMYQDYLDREKNLYFFANEKRRKFEKALNEIVDMSPSWSANETYTNVIRIAVKALKE
jgi:DNA repair ATPase RecN